ncbi:MAG: hypothetical protein WCR97_03580 [Bacilli bacterium]
MKNKVLKGVLLSCALGAMLVSCGAKSVTRDEAIKLLNNIAAYTIDTNTFKCKAVGVISTVDDGVTTTMTTTTNVDVANSYYHVSLVMENSGTKLTTESYSYLDGENIVTVVSILGQNSKTEKAGTAADWLSTNQTNITSISSMSATFATSLSAGLAELDTQTDATVTTEKHTSSGDGNLSAELAATITEDDATTSINETFTFDGNLITSVKTSGDADSNLNYTFDYKNVDTSKYSA